MDILQLTAKGVEKLIQCRNIKVYQSKEIIRKTTKDSTKLISRNKFQPFELDDLEEFQIVTVHVLYQFPSESI